MKTFFNFIFAALLILTLNLSIAAPAEAHLMRAQHGTLNIVDNVVFMALSLPLSAFSGVDENQDGKVSMLEFNRHRAAITARIKDTITLNDNNEKLELKDLLLSPVRPHDKEKQGMTQLAVMGKFALTEPSRQLRFNSTIYGKGEKEQVLKITAIRKPNKQKHVFSINPASTSMELFNHRSHPENLEQ